MNVKKLIAFTFLAMLTNISAYAEVSFSANCKVWQQYHGSNGAIFDSDPSLQCAGTASFENGSYTGVWIGDDFDSNNDDFGNEVDIFAGYAGIYGDFSYDVGVQVFFIERPTAESGNVLNLYAQISKQFSAKDWTATPYFRIDRYQPISDPLPGDGYNFKLGVGLARDYGDDWSFNLDTHVLHDTGAFGFQANEILFVSPTLSRKQFDLMWKYSTPLGSDPQRRNENTLGFAYNF